MMHWQGCFCDSAMCGAMNIPPNQLTLTGGVDCPACCVLIDHNLPAGGSERTENQPAITQATKDQSTS